MSRAGLVLAALLAGAAPLLAQGNGSTGGALLELPATPRQVAFQGAYAAVVGDEGSVFVNPAGMAAIHRLAIGISSERNLFGSQLSTGAVAVRVGHFDVGFGVLYLDLGGDPVIVPDTVNFGGDRGTATGETITAYSGVAVGAIAYRRGMFSIGASAKYLEESIAGGGPTATTHGVTGDLGITFALFDIMAIGYTAQNVTGAIRSGGAPVRLPRTQRLGIALNIVDPQGVPRLLVTTDWVSPPGGDSFWAFGLEGGAVARGVGLLGRAGFAAGRAPSDRRPFSAGAELVVHNIRLEYAWQAYDAIGAASQRFGLRWTR